MTDISITPTSVVAGSDAEREHGTAGETIAAGQAIYRDATTRKLLKADSNAASAVARQPIGVALNGGAVNQPITFQKSGDVTIGATLTPGVAYYLSDTPGGICPIEDVGTGEYVCLIGLAKSATVLDIDIQYPGVAN